MPRIEVPAELVRTTLDRHILVDGFHVVIDLEKSHGNYIHDAVTGKEYLDFYSYFASLPVGHNHPKVVGDDEFLASLTRAAIANPANADIYTKEYAGFVKTFAEVAKPDAFRYLFFVAGGALAVENALKAAFDWKVRQNLARGKGARGTQILHFRQAFHGRTGYTLSLTNTDPTKTDYFPQFDWPRIVNPKLTFPLSPENLAVTVETEKRAFEQIELAFRNNPDDIAGIIIEPIQGEGGDNHFRDEFLQGLRDFADRHEALLIFDEVQTGFGITGKFWAYEHFGVVPDIVCFGKKSQVCGIMSTTRIDSVPDNVFRKSSRINSTWGGNLVDMVRCAKYLEIIRDDHLVENAATVGEYFCDKLTALQTEHASIASNARGRGLFRAFTLPDTKTRDVVRTRCWEKGLATLASGTNTIRFRPCLTCTTNDIDHAVKILDETLRELA